MATYSVTVQPECVSAYDALKENDSFCYLVLGLTDGETTISLLKTSLTGSTYDDFVDDMKEAQRQGECRYAVLHLKYTTSSGENKRKLVLLSWAPVNAKVKPKMAYSSSFASIKNALPGIHKYYQATDEEEISLEVVIKVLAAMDARAN